MGYSGSLTYAVLLCAVLWEVQEAASQITEHPMDQTVPIGQNATFRCTGTQGPVWIVDIATGVRYTTDRQRHIDLLKEMGITSQGRRGELILTVLATEANNNSNVSCRVFVNGGVNFSHVVKLTVLGPPSTPEPSLQILNATTIELTWPPPFSWSAYPIQNYTIKMLNTSNNRLTVRNIDMPQNDTVVTEYFSIPGGQVTTQCSLLQFAVSATSVLGESTPRNLSEGFPIVPRNFTVSRDVSFRNDGTPQLSVEFTPPYVCPFQMADYTIEVKQNGTNETFTHGPVSYSPATMREMVLLRVPAQLVVNTEYVLTVTASTIAGSMSFTTNFNTNFIPPTLTTGTSTSPPNITDHSSPTYPHTTPPPTDTSNVLLVVGSVVGALCGIIIIGIVLLVVGLLCFFVYKKGINEASNTACTNPDLVYETIDKYDPNGLPFKQSPYDFKNSVPTNTRLPVIIEETKQEFSVKMEMQEGQASSSSDDPYTVMNPAQVATAFQKNEHS